MTRGTLSSIGRLLRAGCKVVVLRPTCAECRLRLKRVASCPPKCGRGTKVFYRGGP